jgi:hypothetical protein
MREFTDEQIRHTPSGTWISKDHSMIVCKDGDKLLWWANPAWIGAKGETFLYGGLPKIFTMKLESFRSGGSWLEYEP